MPGPRRHKAWGLLAYLLQADLPPNKRSQLVSLLFGDADDPMGAPARRDALTTARMFAREIDNPALSAIVEAA